MNDNIKKMLVVANKYAQMTISQNDVGNAESVALQTTPGWGRVKAFLSSKTVNQPKSATLSDIINDIKLTFNVSVGPAKNVTKVEFADPNENTGNNPYIYYSGSNGNEKKAIEDTIRTQFGAVLAQNMLVKYKTDAGCKNVIKADAQPNSVYTAVVKVELN